jgi:hypothetical protein
MPRHLVLPAGDPKWCHSLAESSCSSGDGVSLSVGGMSGIRDAGVISAYFVYYIPFRRSRGRLYKNISFLSGSDKYRDDLSSYGESLCGQRIQAWRLVFEVQKVQGKL